MAFWGAEPVDAAAVRARLAAERARDTPFETGRVLGSMCTVPHPIGVEAYRQFLTANVGDPALCPGAKAMEENATLLLGDLLRAPNGFGGVFVSGGSEANFTALRIAMKRAPGKREVVLPATAHFSFDKAIDYLGLVPRVARVRADWRVDVDHVRELVGPETAAVVGIAGTTEHGVVDPIPELAGLCHDLALPLHVDAAYGGFVIPFLKRLGEPLPDFDFALPGVSTIAIDPHKMGLAPIATGALLVRDATDVARIGTPSPYVSVEKQPTLQGTRSGASAAATWAVMRHLGPAGYARSAVECMAVARDVAKRARSLGLDIAREPVLPIVVLKAKDPLALRAKLAQRGFLVALAPLSRGIKIVCMPHVTRAAVDAFFPALEACLRETGDL